MSESPDVKADCYSAGERDAMVAGQNYRAWLLGPLLRTLAYYHATPDQITLVAMLLGLSFAPLYFWSPLAALVALWSHVLLDGVDGPLARHLGVASRRGSFTDSMADQSVVLASTIALMIAHTVGILPGTLYVFFYTVVVLFAMARNFLEIPYHWLVRPRFFVYAWIVVELYLFPGTIDFVLWLCNALLVWKMLTGFIKIRNKI